MSFTPVDEMVVTVPQVYLIRHGIAVERESVSLDQDRPLTSEGEKKTRRVAERLQQLELHFDCLLSSPLLRAKQTAVILQKQGLCDRLEETDLLAPLGNFGTWLYWLEEWRQSGGTSLALVGHQPDLSQWAELLLWGEARGVLILKKAGIIGLSLPEFGSPVGNSQLFWLTRPGLLL